MSIKPHYNREDYIRRGELHLCLDCARKDPNWGPQLEAGKLLINHKGQAVITLPSIKCNGCKKELIAINRTKDILSTQNKEPDT